MISKNRTALILTNDPQLSDTLRRRFHVLHHWNSVSALTGRECSRILHAQPIEFLFVDCRLNALPPGTEELLDWLSEEADSQMGIAAVLNSAVPISIVARLDRLNVKELQFPLLPTNLGRFLDETCRSVNAGVRADRRSLDVNGLEFETRTPAMFPMIERLEQIAHHSVTLLLVGETGTGKTTLARIIHEMSNRREHPFLTTACGALPRELIESELFGHVRGAFTSADRDKIGRFEASEGGTLLLDEIDVLSLQEQTKLLRVIESGEYEPVGTSNTRTADVRLVVASNVNLHTLTEEKRFRADLYYRLNVLEFHLLPLRDRCPDIIPLVVKFVANSSKEHGIEIDRIDRMFLQLVRKYHWPGNLRELRNQIRRAVLLSQNGLLSADGLSPAMIEMAKDREESLENSGHTNGKNPGRISEQLARSEREILVEALRANNNNRSATARALGISRVGFYKRMRRVGLMPPIKKADSPVDQEQPQHII